MMLSHDSYYNYSKVWDASRDIPTFSLVLTSSAAKDGEKHVDHYMHKGLLRKIVGVSELSRWMGVSCSDLRSTLSQYIEAASKGIDEWGKESFRGLPNTNLDNETFYAGTVVPVLHYCMGGLTIDVAGRVLDRNNKIIPGLYAAGEVTGGVHGDNRLGGNSLLECTVFGTIIGKSITIMSRESDSLEKSKTMGVTPETVAKTLKAFSVSDLTYHNRPDDCWIAIHGFVYDLTDFAEEHPGGIESIHRLCGKDGTEEFDSIHSRSIMDDFEEAKVGTFL
jgi:succinate dehydrogenase/fumarate reductase flavoprotein subunit